MCNTLVVLTGVTCNGKSYVAVELKRMYRFFTVHTDLFYCPKEGEKPGSKVGVEDPKKKEYIKSLKEGLTPITILEGSHVGNKKELDIWKKHLDFKGDVYVLEVVNKYFLEWFEAKYGDTEEPEELIEWFKSHNDIEPDRVVTWKEDVIKFLQEKDVLSRDS